VVSTRLATTLQGYGAAAWLSAIGLVTCLGLVFGYHPTLGMTAARRGKGVEDVEVAGVGEEKTGSL
jgi:hypothetical protein